MENIKLTAKERRDSSQFPYRFLLRWNWPDHIDRALRRTMWAWLESLFEEQPVQTDDSDYLGVHVCWLIALHPETPSAVLDLLADQSSAAFQERIAENPNAWPTTLARLANHPSTTVRIAVADNHNTPSEVIQVLSKDGSADVRYAVAENANSAMSVLNSLAQDENSHVAARAQRTLACMHPAQPTSISTARFTSTRSKKVANN